MRDVWQGVRSNWCSCCFVLFVFESFVVVLGATDAFDRSARRPTARGSLLQTAYAAEQQRFVVAVVAFGFTAAAFNCVDIFIFPDTMTNRTTRCASSNTKLR